MKQLSILLLLATALAACRPSTLPASPTEATVAPPSATARPTVIAVTEVPPTDVPGVGGGAEDAAGTEAPTSAGAEGPVITFKRSGGIAGLDEEWAIFADGTIEPREGGRYSVKAEQVAALLAAVSASDFFAMQDMYGRGYTCADCFIYVLTVNAGGQTKTVTTLDAAPDAPPALGELIMDVSNLVAQP